MTSQNIERLLELIRDVVSEGGATWSEKRDQIKSVANEEDMTNLSEFGSWFFDEE